VDIARFLDRLHNEVTQLEAERKAAREQQYGLNQERARLAREGDVELRNRTRELEGKLASLLKEFEFQMRENVRAIEDRAAQQKLSKEAERRIQRLRREFQESFNQTVVATAPAPTRATPMRSRTCSSTLLQATRCASRP